MTDADARIRADDLLRYVRLMEATHDNPQAFDALEHVRAYVEAMVAEQNVAAA